MKPYKKRTLLYLIYNELAFLISGLGGGAIGLALHLILGNTINRALLYGIACTLVTCAALFYLSQREAYEERQFSLKSIALSVLPAFALRWLLVFLLDGNTGFLLCGSASMFTDGETVAELLITLVCFDLLIHLPSFLLGGWWGCHRRKQETEALIQKESKDI